MPVTNPAVLTYDPKMVVASFGPLQISGYADGTFINITRSSGEAFTKRKGAAGDVERVNKNAYDYTIELTVLQTSSINTALSAMLAADQLGNVGVLPFTLEDLLGQTKFFAAQAWIAQDPAIEDGDDTTNRTWTFYTGPAAGVVGGN